MLSEKDVLLWQERYKDLLREAEQERPTASGRREKARAIPGTGARVAGRIFRGVGMLPAAPLCFRDCRRQCSSVFRSRASLPRLRLHYMRDLSPAMLACSWMDPFFSGARVVVPLGKYPMGPLIDSRRSV